MIVCFQLQLFEEGPTDLHRALIWTPSNTYQIKWNTESQLLSSNISGRPDALVAEWEQTSAACRCQNLEEDSQNSVSQKTGDC